MSDICAVSAPQGVRGCYNICPAFAPQGVWVCYNVCPASVPQGSWVCHNICPASAPQGFWACYNVCPASVPQGFWACYNVSPASVPQGLWVCYNICPASAPQGLLNSNLCPIVTPKSDVFSKESPVTAALGHVLFDIGPDSASQDLQICHDYKVPCKFHYSTMTCSKHMTTSYRLHLPIVEKETHATISWLYLQIMLNLHNMLPHMVSMEPTIKSTCRLIHLSIIRGCMQKQDYKFYVRKLHQSLNSNNILIFMQGFVKLFAHAIQTARMTYGIMEQVLHKVLSLLKELYLKQANETSAHNAFNREMGGGIHTFSYDEIQPYALESMEPNKDLYKFKSYTKMTDAYLYDNACVFPKEELVKKLNVAELRVVAKQHNIHTSTKTQRDVIQNLIINHKCNDCPEFVAVFEQIKVDELLKATKLSNHEAVKRYQNKMGSQYKTMNLISVNKYQKHNVTAY